MKKPSIRQPIGIPPEIEDMEKKYDHQFKIVFDAIRQLMKPDEPKKREIGFGREKDA
jgi:hypothetical protein